MGLKNRNKVSAEFSMSSLTDIIFLLLIFFMLTSNFVRIKDIELPEADSKTVAPTSIAVSITKDGDYAFKGKDMPFRQLEGEIKKEIAATAKDREKLKQRPTITIAAEKGTSVKYVSKVLGIANRLRTDAIIATQSKKVN